MTNQEAIEQLRGILTEATEYENSVCYVTEVDREPLEMAIEALENQKVGHWLIREGGNVCSNCGNTQFKYTSLDFDWRPHYCPNCGADMRGE